MIKFFYSISILLLLGLFACVQQKEEMRKKIDVEKIETLEESFAKLDSMFKSSDKEKFKQMSEEEFGIESHFSTGGWIRNNWIREGQLTFIDTWRDEGLKSMDDYSAVILTSHHRYLTQKDIDLEGQLESYRNYYLLNSLPNKSDFPKEIKDVNHDSTHFYELDKTKASLFVLGNKEKTRIWMYTYFDGWKQIDRKVLEEIKNNAPLSVEFVEKLFLE